MTDTQKIFALSRVNGTDNHQDMLAVQNWKWPTGTWLQRRMAEVKAEGEAPEARETKQALEALGTL